MGWLTLGVYALCGLAAVTLTLWSRRNPERMSTPTTLLDIAFESRSARLAILVFWWWLGWHFLFAQTVDP